MALAWEARACSGQNLHVEFYMVVNVKIGMNKCDQQHEKMCLHQLFPGPRQPATGEGESTTWPLPYTVLRAGEYPWSLQLRG